LNVLREIIEMKKQGKTEEDIVNTLKEAGVTPGEIINALNQSKIKSAVTNEQGKTQGADENTYVPQPQEEYSQNYAPEPSQAIYQPEQQEYYPQENYESYPQETNTNTIMEIAEQIFFEKIKKIQKQVETMNEFKNLHQAKVENIDERIKRIESTIDNLQGAILEKIGEYGNNLQSIKNEMGMMQDSFGKAMKEFPGQKIHSPTKHHHPKTAKKKTAKK
jgi:hypothetical protein